MDGTFNYAPKYFTQIYNILGYHNGFYIQLAFVFLVGKSEVLYTDMWKMLLDLCQQEVGAEPSIDELHLDFELSAVNSLSDVFPDSKIVLCRFHLGQSFIKKMMELLLILCYKNNDSETGNWLKLFFGLPFLPPCEVPEGFTTIFAIAPECPKADKFADYVLNTYVKDDARFPPKLWAAAPDGIESPRTTNGVEAHNKHYNSQFYSSHPSCHVVIDNLIDIQAEVYVKIKTQTQKKATSSSKISEKKAKLVHKLYTQYQSDEITLLEYLRKVGLKYLPVTV